MSQQVIVFEVGSSLGFFRKPFSTTNALTHAVIPRSTVEGLIGAILGLKSEEYPEKLETSKIGVEILSPVKKYHMKTNFTHVDWWNKAENYLTKKNTEKTTPFNSPTNMEYLVSPKYRIYFSNEAVNSELDELLKNQKSKFTPYLGASSNVAYINYLGKFDCQKSTSSGFIGVSTVIPFFEDMPSINADKETRFVIEEGLSLHITKDRISKGTYNVILSENLKEIPVKGTEIYKVLMNGSNPNIVFLPTRV